MHNDIFSIVRDANLSDAESAKIFPRLDHLELSLRRHVEVGAGLT